MKDSGLLIDTLTIFHYVCFLNPGSISNLLRHSDSVLMGPQISIPNSTQYSQCSDILGDRAGKTKRACRGCCSCHTAPLQTEWLSTEPQQHTRCQEGTVKLPGSHWGEEKGRQEERKMVEKVWKDKEKRRNMWKTDRYAERKAISSSGFISSVSERVQRYWSGCLQNLGITISLLHRALIDTAVLWVHSLLGFTSHI